MKTNRSLLASAAAVAFGLFGAVWATIEARAQETKPNILFVLMDNLGYGELGVYGGGILRGAPTPRIDELAAEGTRLTNFNVEAQCTPSRSAIMTGRFSIRSGAQSIPIGGEFDRLTRWEVTIADALSAAGYPTGGRSPLAGQSSGRRRAFPRCHIMEGRQGEPARDIAVYDLE